MLTHEACVGAQALCLVECLPSVLAVLVSWDDMNLMIPFALAKAAGLLKEQGNECTGICKRRWDA